MTLDGAAVLIATTLFVGAALSALLGRGHRYRLIAAWVAMVGFAALSSFCCWTGVLLRRGAVPVYVDLPSSTGPQKVTIVKPGLSPGYRVRLVRRKDHAVDPALAAGLAGAGWHIAVCEKLVLSDHTFDSEGVIEFESEYPDVVLAYDAMPELRARLEEASVEVTCPAGARKGLAQRIATWNERMAFCLGGLLLAGLGASSQRRKLKRPTVQNPREVRA